MTDSRRVMRPLRAANTVPSHATASRPHWMGDLRRLRAGAVSQGIVASDSPGSTRWIRSCATSCDATGMSSVSSLFPLESAPPTPAMFTRTRTHPCRLHSSGSTISIACTRPGGTVRVSVFARPNFRRRPSGDWLTVKLKYLMNSAKTMMIGRPPVTSAEPEAAPAAAEHRDDDDRRREQQQAGRHGPHHQRQREIARGDGRDRDLRRLADVVAEPGRAGEHLAAQGARLVERQELELDA